MTTGDPAVYAVQEWLNLTYEGRAGYQTAPENGKTGWSTIYSLTRALQLELGITNTADSFGPTTAKEYNKFGILELGKVPDTEQGSKIVKILQGAMYCKGYNPGGFTGRFGETMKNSIIKLQTDAGLPVRDGRVYDYVFKAFLTMDAFVLTIGGNAKVREIQQELNNKYYTTSGVQPCDGHYQRGTNKALIYGLQTEIGIPAANQTGSVGPATKAGLPVLNEGKSGQFVKLFQYALFFNNFDASPFNGVYESNVKNAVLAFQKFTLLTPSGTADLQTWLSTLLSTGDPERKGKACDGITEVTPERAQTLKENGYKTIGRYLVNVPGGLNKKIQPGELQTIFTAGLSVYPIYQTFGNKTSYFKYDQGVADANEAYKAAKDYGFKNETIIYFAVDFDAYGTDITNDIIPYFRGVNSQFIKLGSPYRVGVYGARNVCIQVSERGLATTSFVCGMSTGFSGNLGYPLPANWAFDQISTKTFGSGNGRIEIDNNIMSGLDLGQTSVGGSLSSLNAEALDELKIIYDLAMEYTGRVRPLANYLVSNYYKKVKYNFDLWAYVSGGVVQEFVDYVKENYKDVTEFKDLKDPKSRQVIGIEHLMATLSAELHAPNVPIIGNHIKDFAGWFGDILQFIEDVFRERQDTSSDSTYEAALELIGAKFKTSKFSYDDYMGDVDAVNLANNLYSDPTLSIYDAFVRYYEGGEVMSRFSDFYETKFNSKNDDAQSSTEVYLNSTSIIHTDIAYARKLFKENFSVPDYTEEEGITIAKAWADKISFDAANE